MGEQKGNYRYSISGITYNYSFRIVGNRDSVVKCQGMISTFTLNMARDIVLKIIERLEEGW